jgi:phage terminase Nu1 subunit (DNA packaging protein)
MPTETTKSDSDLITEKELAHALRVSTKTVATWRESGIVPFFGRGYVIRYRLSQVLEALQHQAKV